MGRLLRMLRGAIKMGVVWGFVWSLAGVGLAIITRFQADTPFPIVFGLFGFLAGVSFATIFAMTSRRLKFEEMSLPRFAGWGAAGGALLAGVFSQLAGLSAAELFVVAPVFAMASAVCATGTLALARKASGSGAIAASDDPRRERLSG